MIKIAVCDDEKEVCNKLEVIIKSYFDQIKRSIWIGKFQSGIDLLNVNICFDIIFLDIGMPNLDGIETAVKLRTWDINSKIIYVTNYNNFSHKAYKVHAFDYVSKPICEKKIYEVLSDVIKYLDYAVEKQKYAFKTEEGIMRLELEDIYSFEYLARRVIINCSQGRYTATYSLKELLEKFHNHNFASPHKSFIVNMLHIKCIKGFDIFMENGEKIPLAQKRAVDFKCEFNNFLQSTFDRI